MVQKVSKVKVVYSYIRLQNGVSNLWLKRAAAKTRELKNIPACALLKVYDCPKGTGLHLKGTRLSLKDNLACYTVYIRTE